MRTSLFAIVGMLCLPAIASADLFNFQQNLFVSGDMNASNSDVQGSVAVGGNLTLSSYVVGLKLPGWDGSSNSLVAGGNVNLNHVTVWNGSLRYGGPATLASVAFPNGGNSAQGTPLDLGAQSDYYQHASSYFSTLSSSGDVNINFSTLSLTASGGGLKVFNLTTADLVGITSLRIVAPSDATVLVNIVGESAVLKNMGMSLSGGIVQTHVLYNFPTATTLNVQGIGVLGSILAPQSEMSFDSGVLLGDVAVGGYTGPGEINDYHFVGEIPLPVPEPATAMVGVLGLGLLTLRRRSRVA